MNENIQLLDLSLRDGDSSSVDALLTRMVKDAKQNQKVEDRQATVTISMAEAKLLRDCQNDIVLEKVLEIPRLRINGISGAASQVFWWKICMDRLALGAIWSPLLDKMAARGWVSKYDIERLNKADGTKYPDRPPREIMQELGPWIKQLGAQESLKLLERISMEKSSLVSNYVADNPNITVAVLERLSQNIETLCRAARSNLSLNEEALTWLWRQIRDRFQAIYDEAASEEFNLAKHTRTSLAARAREADGIRALARHLGTRKVVPPKDVEESFMAWAVIPECGELQAYMWGPGILSRNWVRLAARKIVTLPYLERSAKELQKIILADQSPRALLMVSQRTLEPITSELIATILEAYPEVDEDDEAPEIKEIVNNLAKLESLAESEVVRRIVRNQKSLTNVWAIWPRIPEQFKPYILEGWIEAFPHEILSFLEKKSDEDLRPLHHRLLAKSLNNPDREVRMRAIAVAARIAEVNEVAKEAEAKSGPPLKL